MLTIYEKANDHVLYVNLRKTTIVVFRSMENMKRYGFEQ
jgi:hypothetical protein